MNVMRYLALWLLAFIFTSAVDAFWHLVVFRKAYTEGMKPLARMQGDKTAFKAIPGLVAQVLVVTCIVFLVLYGMQKGQIWEAILIGALCGVLAITVYGFTNYSLLKDWTLKLTLLEIIWGPTLGAVSGAFVFWLRTLLLR